MVTDKQNTKKINVAMVAYAYYFTDARIKNYVKTLVDRGINVDIFALVHLLYKRRL